MSRVTSTSMGAARGTSVGGGRLSVSAGIKFLKSGLLGVLDISSRKSRIHPFFTYAQLAVRTFQMLSFLTGDKAGAPWPSALSPLEAAASFSNLRGYTVYVREEVTRVAFWLAAVWVSLLLVLLAWGIRAFAEKQFQVLWPLRLLSLMGGLSATILFIPLLQCLLYLQEMYGADTTAAPAVTAVVAILAFILCSLSFLFASAFYNSDLLSPHPAAKAHGRNTVTILLLQTVLVVQQRWEMANWLRVFILACVGVVWLGGTVYALPFYAHKVNRLETSGATLYLWGVICLTMNVAYRSTDAAVMLYLGLPFALASGVALADWRANRIVMTPPALLSSAVEVELKARYILHTALYGHPIIRRSGGMRGFAPVFMPAPSAAVTGQASPAPARGVATAAGGGKQGAAVAGAGAPAPAAGESTGMGVGVGVDNDLLFEGGGPDDERDEGAGKGQQGHEGGMRVRLPMEVVGQILALYRAASGRLRSSALLHVFCARFYHDVVSSRHMQLSHLLQAERRAPPLDLSFIIFRARTAAQRGGSESTNAMNRVAWEKYAQEARREVQHSAHKQLAFWAELLDACPDLSRLHRLSTETNAAILAAERAFSELTALNAQSVAILRLYAVFQECVTCNVDKASVLAQEAERIEDAKSKEHRMEGNSRVNIMGETNADVWAENTAMLHVSANARDVGMIRAVNASACRLLGYTRLQLERRSVFTILPPGLAELHEDSMRQYVSTGEGVPGIVGYTRAMLLQNKAGCLLPVVSAVRDAPADDGPPTFLWALREMRMAHQYILLDSTGRILAVDARSQVLLGVDPTDLSAAQADGPTMLDFCVEWPVQRFQSEILSAAGCTMRVDVVSSGSDRYIPPSPAPGQGGYGQGSGLRQGQGQRRQQGQAGSPGMDEDDNDGGDSLAQGFSDSEGGGSGSEGEGEEERDPGFVSRSSPGRGQRGMAGRRPGAQARDAGTSRSSTGDYAAHMMSSRRGGRTPLPKAKPHAVVPLAAVGGSYGATTLGSHTTSAVRRASTSLGATGATGGQGAAYMMGGMGGGGYGGGGYPHPQAAAFVETTWLRCHMHPVPLGARGGLQGYVLQWTALPAHDTISLAKAEEKRASFVSMLQVQEDLSAQQAQLMSGLGPPVPPLAGGGAASLLAHANARDMARTHSARPGMAGSGGQAWLSPRSLAPGPAPPGPPGLVQGSPPTPRSRIVAQSYAQLQGAGGGGAGRAGAGSSWGEERPAVRVGSEGRAGGGATRGARTTHASLKKRASRSSSHGQRSASSAEDAAAAAAGGGGMAGEEASWLGPYMRGGDLSDREGEGLGEGREDQHARSGGSREGLALPGAVPRLHTQPQPGLGSADRQTELAEAVGIISPSSSSAAATKQRPEVPPLQMSSHAPSHAVTSSSAMTQSAVRSALKQHAMHARRASGAGPAVSSSIASVVTAAVAAQAGAASFASFSSPVKQARAGSYVAGGSPATFHGLQQQLQRRMGGESEAGAGVDRGGGGGADVPAPLRSPPQVTGMRLSKRASAPETITGAGDREDGQKSTGWRGRGAGSLASSQKSGSSGMNSTVKSMARLRRLLSEENTPLLPGLRWLRLAGTGLSAIAILLATVLAIVTRQNFLELLRQTQYVGLGAQRMVYKASAIEAAQDLMFDGRKWKNLTQEGKALARQYMLGNRSLFSDVHRQMFNLVQDKPTAREWTTRYITYTVFGLPVNPVQGIGGQYMTLNLNEVGEAFASLMKEMASGEMSEEDYATYNDGCALGEPRLAQFGVEFMRGGNAHEALQSSMDLGYRASITGVQQVKNTQFIAYLCMAGTILLVGATVFYPILRQIDRNSDTVMLQFVRLPTLVRAELYIQALKRSRALKRFSADDDEDGDLEDEEDTDGEEDDSELLKQMGLQPASAQQAEGTAHVVISMTAAPGGGGGGGGGGAGVPTSPRPGGAGAAGAGAAAGGVSSQAGQVDWAKILDEEGEEGGGSLHRGLSTKSHSFFSARSGGGSGGGGGKAGRAWGKGRGEGKGGQGPRPFRKTGSAVLLFMMRYMTPLLALLVFFSVIYGSFSVVVERTITLTSISAAADRRASCARQAFIDLRKLSFLTTDAQYITNTYFYTIDAYQCVKDHVRLLAYGRAGSQVDSRDYAPYTLPVENGAPSVLSTEVQRKVYNAMFKDACPLLAEAAERRGGSVNMSACDSFGGGIVSLGLSSLVDNVWKTVLQVGDRQLRGQFIEGKLYEGHGWSAPVEAMNYSSLICTPAVGCEPVRTLSAPFDGSVLPHSHVSDPTYTGDHKAHLLPGQGTVPNGSTPYRITWELNHPQMIFLEQVDSQFLTPALLYIADLYRAESQAAVSSFLTFLGAFVPAYMVVFVLGMMTYFQTMIQGTNKAIQAKRAMLLYLPVPVVAKSPSIKALIAEILAAEADGAGGSLVLLPGVGGGGPGAVGLPGDTPYGDTLLAAHSSSLPGGHALAGGQGAGSSSKGAGKAAALLHGTAGLSASKKAIRVEGPGVASPRA